MKNKLFRSVRIEIVTYVIISLILSLITTLLITFGLFMLRDFIKRDSQNLNSPVQSAGTTASVQGDASQMDNVEKDIRVNENIKTINGRTDDNILSRYQEDVRIKLSESRRFAGFIVIEMIVCFIFFFSIYFVFFTKKIVDYFEQIDRGIEEFSEGNFDIEFEVRNEDELSNMARNLNRTTGEINRILAKERDEEKSRKEFITCIAHDLRTPLTSVIGYLQLVMAKAHASRSNEELQIKNEEYVKIAYEKAIRLQGLIEELFSFTKTDSTELRLHLTEIDVVKLMEQLADECYPSLQEAGLALEFKTSAEVIKIEADGELMARAIANLLTNGIKYGKDGKKIIIDLYRENENSDLHIRIINYGRLIPEKDIDHIFDKFYRVEDSRSLQTGGAGLGLAITQNIVKLHGGCVNVKSDLSGTVFEIVLPAK
ncbi:sensor histidine kinase [Catonella massiliensis]|uniref:histidine kinase n=1 Tax=Catonella massiliensis TaxID=2799636 RepID=A0ABS1J1E5_9FIRM|nr:HAMP domain-containing sensor histidine kinase [Catonella massiliensis]MBK5897872.1 HAMP domain-containing histidine kinase [Catonella massiliensis]